MWDKKIFPQANMVQDARATAILGTCKSAGDRVFESRRPHQLQCLIGTMFKSFAGYEHERAYNYYY